MQVKSPNLEKYAQKRTLLFKSLIKTNKIQLNAFLFKAFKCSKNNSSSKIDRFQKYFKIIE